MAEQEVFGQQQQDQSYKVTNTVDKHGQMDSKKATWAIPLTSVAWGVGAQIASNIMGKSGLNTLLGFPDEKTTEAFLLKSYFDYNKGLSIKMEKTYKKTKYIKKTTWYEKGKQDTEAVAALGEDGAEYLGETSHEYFLEDGSINENPRVYRKIRRTTKQDIYKDELKANKNEKDVSEEFGYDKNSIKLDFTPEWNDTEYTGWYYTNDFMRMFIVSMTENPVCLCLPCLNGHPRITMAVVGNERPVASNTTPATTNRVTQPRRFVFSFPIAYLTVYGLNSAGSIYGLQKDNWAEKARSKMTEWKAKAEGNVNNWLNKIYMGKKMDERDWRNAGKKMQRNIDTLEAIYTYIRNFPTQNGVKLYTGFNEPSIECTCSIELSFGKENMDCLYVDISLVETLRFDASQMTAKYATHNARKQTKPVQGKTK